MMTAPLPAAPVRTRAAAVAAHADASSPLTRCLLMCLPAVGGIPLEWYKEEDHIGYDIEVSSKQSRGAQPPE